MTVKEVFDLRKQGKIEEAYDAIRPMYRVHKGRYTTLCMFWVASDIFKKRMDEGRTEEARKIFEALKRMQPRVDAINKELDNQTAATPAATATKYPWEKTDQQHSAATAFLQYAEKRLGLKGTSNTAKEAVPQNNNSCNSCNSCSEKESGSTNSPSKLEGVPKGRGRVSDKLQRLLDILKGPMSVREMMAALGFGSRDKFLKNYLSPALKSGLIEMTQPDSPKSPTQRYRRTKGGQVT